MRTCAQKVPVVKEWVDYMPRKGLKVDFRILLVISLYIYYNITLVCTCHAGNDVI